MEFVTRPHPDPEQEEALALALERLVAGEVRPPAYRSRWRAEGIAENVGAEAEAEFAGAPPCGGAE